MHTNRGDNNGESNPFDGIGVPVLMAPFLVAVISMLLEGNWLRRIGGAILVILGSLLIGDLPAVDVPAPVGAGLSAESIATGVMVVAWNYWWSVPPASAELSDDGRDKGPR